MFEPPKGKLAGSAGADARDPRGFEPGDTLGERYRVERVLARGGMGVLVAATDLSLDRAVALKFLIGETLADPKAQARFLREARLAAKLRSEHVVKILDIGSVAERGPFIAMELLEGRDLKAHVAERGALPVATATEIVLQACEAIAEAHSHGIVHRDLKSRNLFLARHVHGAPLVKVLDFGISKVALAKGGAWTKRADEVTLTGTGEIMGSTSYMPPEQLVSARDVDATADIWSLGVVLFELLTGALPFRGDTPKAVAVAILGGDPRLHELAGRAPPELVAVIARCLDRAPSKRFRSVAALAAALEPFAGASSRGAAERVAGAGSIAPPAAARSAAVVVPPDRGEGSESVATTIPARKARAQRARWSVVAGLGAVGGLLLLALRSSGPPAVDASASAEATAVEPAATAPVPIAPMSSEPVAQVAATATAPADVPSAAALGSPTVSPPSAVSTPSTASARKATAAMPQATSSGTARARPGAVSSSAGPGAPSVPRVFIPEEPR